MNPARWPRADPNSARLLFIAGERIENRRVRELPDLLEPGDLVIVNDSATLPASLSGKTADGASIELRLLAREDDGTWKGILFGAGDWRQRTEDREPPPEVRAGARLVFGELAAKVVERDGRLARVEFDKDGSGFWAALYRAGRPIQYSYLDGALALWDVQTAYGGRPWSVESPSAGYSLTGSILLRLRQRGVELATITHADGLSSTGDEALDATLPQQERFDVPQRTIDAIARARRVIAVGTTVVRALEGSALQHDDKLVAGAGVTTLLLGPGYKRRVVDGLLTGIHDPTASHYALLQAFAARAVLDQAHAQAEEWGYLGHEFGDACLIL